VPTPTPLDNVLWRQRGYGPDKKHCLERRADERPKMHEPADPLPSLYTNPQVEARATRWTWLEPKNAASIQIGNIHQRSQLTCMLTGTKVPQGL